MKQAIWKVGSNTCINPRCSSTPPTLKKKKTQKKKKQKNKKTKTKTKTEQKPLRRRCHMSKCGQSVGFNSERGTYKFSEI
jgi:hypothetical protein